MARFLLQPDKVEKVVLATCALHNFLRTHRQAAGITIDTDTEQGNWRDNADANGLCQLERVPRRAGNDAKAIRDSFKDYFNNEGAVPWQDNMI